MNIKKLITDLQVCADDDIICPACDRYHEMKEKGGTADCVNKLLRDAAEELTELLDENDNLQQRIFILRELAPKQKWIPVTERLPTEEEWLEAEQSSFLCRAHVPVPGGVAVENIKVIPYTFYNGWECEGIIITHWMPLPEAPEEDNS